MKLRMMLPLFLVLAAVALLVAGNSSRIQEGLLCNRLSMALVNIFGERLPLDEYLRILGETEPPACTRFQLGLLSQREGDEEQARAFFSASMLASPAIIPAVRAHFPVDAQLAAFATQALPRSAEAWDWAADAALKSDPPQQEAALLYLLKSAELDASDNLVWEKIGGLAGQLGQTEVAIEALKNACDLYPVRNGSCLSAARLSYDEGDYESVIRYYTQGYFPENPDGWARLISAARLLGRTAATARYLDQAQQEYPADFESLIKTLTTDGKD